MGAGDRGMGNGHESVRKSPVLGQEVMIPQSGGHESTHLVLFFFEKLKIP